MANSFNGKLVPLGAIIVQDGDDVYIVYNFPQLNIGGQNFGEFSFKYLLTSDPQSLIEIGSQYQVDYEMVNGELVQKAADAPYLDPEYYSNSLFAGTDLDLAGDVSITGNENAPGYKVFIDTLNKAMQLDPAIGYKNTAGEYEILNLFLEASLEGRPVSQDDLRLTEYHKTSTAAQKKAISDRASNPADFARNQANLNLELYQHAINTGYGNPNMKVIEFLASETMLANMDKSQAKAQLDKIGNPRLKYALNAEVQALLNGDDINRSFGQQRVVKNNIDYYLGQGASANYDVQNLAWEMEANPDYMEETFIPQLEAAFKAKYTSWADSHIKSFAELDAALGQQWLTETGQTIADKTSPMYHKYLNTRDEEARNKVITEYLIDTNSPVLQEQAEGFFNQAFGSAFFKEEGFTPITQRSSANL